MTSVLDILIGEIASILGISAADVKSKFTEAQLNELLNLSLCEPVSESGVPFDITEPPCEEPAPAASLLSPLSIDTTPPSPTSNVEQCIEKVAELNQQIADQNENYSNHRILLDKLIEYRDNYGVMLYYFEERSKEAARLTNIFEPIIIEIRRLEQNLAELEKRATGFSTDSSGTTISLPGIQLNSINSEINNVRQAIADQNAILSRTAQTVPIFSDDNYTRAYDALSKASYSDISIAPYLADIYGSIVSNDTLRTLKNQLEDYSSCITPTIEASGPPRSIQEAVERNYFSFVLEFPQLDFIKTEKEKFNESTGEDYREDSFFPVKNNPLLQKNDFFSDYSVISVRDYFLNNTSPPTGTLYERYYNLFEDPENNFFTLFERGLSSDSGDVDPKLKESNASVKKEKNQDYYIRDFDTMQNFYKNFDERFEARKEERRAEVITPSQNSIRFTMQTIAKKEIQLLLAISGISSYLPSESKALASIFGKLRTENSTFSQRISDLDEEINRIRALLPEIKPTPQKIKELLKQKSPECFSREPEPENSSSPECTGAREKLGIDPFFAETLGGCDPTLPNQNQICYWIEFSKIASLMGLLPLPNLPNVTKLRYWPVGLTVPSPIGLIKIPLPIIWIPLVTISTPLGNVVIFLTINGIFISPVVFFVSSSGFKQHILTIRGSSKRFGYTSEDAVLKNTIQKPVLFLAGRDAASRLAQESSNGEYYSFSEKEKEQIVRQKNILDAAEKSAIENDNSIKKAKVAREKNNFAQATSNESSFERMAKTLDKLDSAKDVIADAKRAILNRIDELGRPSMSSSNSIKEKIITRRSQLFSELQQSLEEGNLGQASALRQALKTDGVSLAEKLNAIEKDLLAYFDRVDFPKVTIPKDASTIDPKPNAIVDFLDRINEFASIHRTQFYSKDDSKVRRILSVQLAKSKSKIKAAATKKTSTDGFLDVDRDLDKIKKTYREANKIIIDAVCGRSTRVSPSTQQAKVDDLKGKLAKESDPVKKIKLKQQLEKEQMILSESLENERIKQALVLTPAVLASLTDLRVDFDPFTPCCKKKPFSLNVGLSPAIPIFESAKGLLDSYVDSLSSATVRALFGGKNKITASEISAAYLSIVKKAIPANLEIPLPGLNLLSFSNAFAGLLTSLFEIKAPITAAQPALPKSITIDLNILKRPLVSILITFLRNSMPDASSAVEPLPNQNAPTTSSSSEIVGATSQATAATALANQKAQSGSILDRKINIVDCEPDSSQKSSLSGGSILPKSSPEKKGDPETSSSLLQPYLQPTSSAFSSGNVIVSSNKEILPNFFTLDSDFLSVNPADLVAILKNFVDLQFDQVEKLLDPFYQLLSIVRGAKGVNLNILEEAQYKLPPYGPALKQIFNAIATLKKEIPRSATVQSIDTNAVQSGAQLLKTVLGPIVNSPLPAAIVAAAGAADSLLPATKVASLDSDTGTISTKDVRPATFALRALHPLLVQEDLPPWERLSAKNLLFLLFLDEFISNGADKIGFFRSYI